MKINVHAGHNPDGKAACGAIGLIRESTEARRVKDEVISQLRQMGHIVHDCTCDVGANKTDVLNRIVKSCNADLVDLDVSIHFNSGAKDNEGNGRSTGTETYVYSVNSKAKPYAERICTAISEHGFRNRGVKISNSLYFLRNTKAPAVLVECCFVDDRDDVQLYDYKQMAAAIVYGITGKRVLTPVPTVPDTAGEGDETPTGDRNQIYRVQVLDQRGAFEIRANAERMLNDLKAKGFDAIITTA